MKTKTIMALFVVLRLAFSNYSANAQFMLSEL